VKIFRGQSRNCANNSDEQIFRLHSLSSNTRGLKMLRITKIRENTRRHKERLKRLLICAD
jgi:hypothetical protein